jgi:ABC-type phosphate transport system substrate-binding protein
MRARAAALGAALACGLAVLGSALPLSAEELLVIVHRERSERLGVDDVAQIYLKQRRHWRDGDAIVPVNREPESELRAAFARAVLALSPQQLSVHWNRQYFLGVLPPATLASDEAVKRFVARERRAIGYIRASALDDSVRVALRLDGSASAPPGP